MRSNEETSIRPHRQARGISVLEMMIGLAALGIVLLVAVPGSNLLIDSYRMKVASDSIITGLELARSEAVMRSGTVVLCPSSNGHTCRTDKDWSLGWLVFSDGNGDGAVQEIELIKAFGAPSQEIRITAEGAVQNRASFTATGLNADSNARSGQFHICPRNPAKTATLITVDDDGWVQKMPTRDSSCLAS